MANTFVISRSAFNFAANALWIWLEWIWSRFISLVWLIVHLKEISTLNKCSTRATFCGVFLFLIFFYFRMFFCFAVYSGSNSTESIRKQKWMQSYSVLELFGHWPLTHSLYPWPDSRPKYISHVLCQSWSTVHTAAQWTSKQCRHFKLWLYSFKSDICCLYPFIRLCEHLMKLHLCLSTVLYFILMCG